MPSPKLLAVTGLPPKNEIHPLTLGILGQPPYPTYAGVFWIGGYNALDKRFLFYYCGQGITFAFFSRVMPILLC